MKANNRKYLPFVIVMALIVVFFTGKGILDLRAKAFMDVVPFKEKEFQSLEVVWDVEEIGVENDDTWLTEEKERLDELLTFLSQYEVKRISENQFEEISDKGKGLKFIITHEKKRPVIVWLSENYVHIYVNDYYKVVNGSIDQDWLNNFYEKYKATK